MIRTRSGLGPILSNFAWLSGDKIARLGIQFVVGAIIARHLGSEGFGILNVALAATGLVAVFASLGFDGILSRELLRETQRADLLLGTVFLTRLAAVLLLYPVVAIFARNQAPDSQATLLISGLALLFIPLAVFNTHFEVRLQARYTVWAANASFVLCTIVRIWLVSIGASVACFAATYLIEPGVTAIILYFIYRRFGGRLSNWRLDLTLASSLFKQSWPLMLSGFAIMIYMRLDQIMLAKMRGDAEAGIFAAALRFSEVWYFIPAALSSSLLPSLIRNQKLAPAAYEAKIGQFYDINSGLAYALIAVLVPTAPWLFQLVYGQGFAGADTVFQIHIWASLFVFLGVARSSYLINEGFASFAFYSTLVGALLNVLLNLFLIPKYGAQGAAVATVFSHMVAAFISSFFWKRIRPNGQLQLRALLLPWRVIWWLLRRLLDRRELTLRKKFFS
ncbi:MAG TPA: flippase [Terrimicrobiaceae bacterium]